jgi:glycosyltransferase involved in cell wall biosynthesis
MQQSLLTIAIPTFNRAPKLKRLLNIIKEEITTSHLQESVRVLVSDNASADQTPVIASEFKGTGLKFTYYRQPQNLGLDGDLRLLYTHANSRYFWFMADDDYPLKGAVVSSKQ